MVLCGDGDHRRRSGRPRRIAALVGVLGALGPGLRTPVGAQSPTAQPPSATPASPDDRYVLGPDSKPQQGVPAGELLEFTLEHTKLFPGTRRKITVYVPAEYTGDKPACLYVGLDGLGFQVPTVFDNLIYKHDMPVTIAIGIQPGAAEASDSTRSPRYNRSFEFDGLNDNLARFVADEVIPAVEQRQTHSGLAIRISDDPNDRAAGGASTGGIGAFTLAWEHPDSFRRVFTAIGTFVGMRGGDRYPVLIRKTEPKPIRIFMQDGSHDEWMGGPEVGDWWISNQAMESALRFAGYQVEHVWGDGTHNGAHATSIFPEAMRWLWKDWPRPVSAGTSQNVLLSQILLDGAGWMRVPDDDADARTLLAHSMQHHVGDHEGRTYVAETGPGTLSLIDRDGKRTVLDAGLKDPTGIALTPDGSWLAVAERRSHWGYSYRVQPGGTVGEKQRFYWFHVPDDADDADVAAWVMDRDGRLYAATRMGVQVFDHNGRVRAILPVPGGAITAIAFGGEDLQNLFVSNAKHEIYRRKLKVPGAPPGGGVTKLPDWGPG
jgi:gluconolactonase